MVYIKKIQRFKGKFYLLTTKLFKFTTLEVVSHNFKCVKFIQIRQNVG